jgi:hypothetical protein
MSVELQGWIPRGQATARQGPRAIKVNRGTYFIRKVSPRFGPRPGVLRVFRRASANVLRGCCPSVQLPCGLDTTLLCIECFLRACREDTSAAERLYQKYLLRGNRCFKCQTKAKAALALDGVRHVCARYLTTSDSPSISPTRRLRAFVTKSLQLWAMYAEPFAAVLLLWV